MSMLLRDTCKMCFPCFHTALVFCRNTQRNALIVYLYLQRKKKSYMGKAKDRALVALLSERMDMLPE